MKHILVVADRLGEQQRIIARAVELASRVGAKQALNYEIVERAAALSGALGCQLHIGYAVPFSAALQDLDIISVSSLRREGVQRAEEFGRSLAQRGITVDGLHVVTGKPEKALVSLAAKKAADVLAIKPRGLRASVAS